VSVWAAPEITGVGERMRAGQGFDAAFAPLAAVVADLFAKWSYVASLPFQPG